LISVGALSLEAVTEIAQRAAGKGASASAAARIAPACEGRPFLAQLGGRSLAGEPRGERPGDASLVGWLADRVRALPPVDRSVLAALVAADGPRAVNDIAGAVGLRVAEVERALAELETDFLVRRADRRAADVYHDLVRATATDVLGSEAVRRAHEGYARLYATAEDVPLYRRVLHLAGAGSVAEASPFARAAAIEAEEQRAYGLAAEMYRLALTGADADVGLWRARAAALEQMGWYRAAVECWRAVQARAQSPEDVSDARFQEARSLLAAGAYTEGLARLDDVLTSAGEPSVTHSAWKTARTALSFVTGPLSMPPPAIPAPDQAGPRVQRQVHAALSVSTFDPIAGIALLQRAQRTFVRAGEVDCAAWCDFTFSYLAELTSPKAGPVGLADRYRARAEARLGGRESSILEVRTFPNLLTATRAFREGRWEDARRVADAGIRAIESLGCGATNTYVLGLASRLDIEHFAQNALAFEVRLRLLRAALRENRDVALRYHVWLSDAVLLTFQGEAARALAVAEDAARDCPQGVRSVASLTIDTAIARFTRACGDAVAARALQAALVARYGSWAVQGSMYVGANAAEWALCEVLALRAGDKAASARRVRSYARIARKAPPLAATGAIRALAYLAEHEGAPSLAIALLAEAEGKAFALDQRVDAGIARYQRGLRLGGSEGAQLARSAAELVTSVGASERLLYEV
jgi:hypothetical protein